MEVASVNAAQQAGRTGPSEASSAADKSQVDYDTYLKLLIAQMRNQDPTQPMDATEQIAQLATFSQVEQTIQTNKNLEKLLSQSALSQADAVLGRTLTSADGAVSGTVAEVRIVEGGAIAVLDGGKEIPVAPGVTIR